jgi:hypothetical protein
MLYDDTAGLRGADSQVDEQSGGTWLAFRRPSPNAAIADIEVLRASKFDFGPLVCIAEASSCGLGLADSDHPGSPPWTVDISKRGLGD